MTSDVKLPESFLRGLEADLRALCADARRKNPQVKEAAERVILSLKEADTPQLEIQAADNAAAAFCAACEPPPPTASSTTISSHTKIIFRAITSLHKLLTHRAVSSDHLPQVLDALHRLSIACIDDTITLKVLQGLLSLLTVRSYSKVLSEDDLSRAFSLLFVLKTSRSQGSSNPASNALSAISHMSSSPDSGVIEQTSKAAFRQASSDLFASAADGAVQTAVRLQVPTGEVISIENFPTETRASYRFFMDLCKAAAGEPLVWLSSISPKPQLSSIDLDLTLALEVIDDGLSTNIGLFAAQPVFLELLSKELCPVVHKLLTAVLDKNSSASLFALVVTIVRHYWHNLPIESQSLMQAIADICQPMSTNDADGTTWSVIHAMEAMRCIFRSQLDEPNAVIDFVRTLELSDESSKSLSSVITIVSNVLVISATGKPFTIPPSPITGALKPFAKTIANNSSFLIGLATGLYLDIFNIAQESVNKHAYDVAQALLNPKPTIRAVEFLGKLIEHNPFHLAPSSARLIDGQSSDPMDVLSTALARVILVAHSCEVKDVQMHAFSTLSSVCASTARNKTEAASESEFAKQVACLYNVLFSVVSKCQESLGRSWNGAVDAFEALDSLVYSSSLTGEKQGPFLSSTLATLKPKLDAVFTTTRDLKWTACHDMISALVQCSRLSMVSVSKRVMSSEPSKTDEDVSLRVFGISAAEIALLNAFHRTAETSEPMPSTLWELLTGHLTSVCADGPLYSLRLFSLNSLTRIACGAIQRTGTSLVPHEKVVTPFLDLFNSVHADVRSGSLASLYSMLETQGERLEGEAAWRVVLDILTTAGDSGASSRVKNDSNGKRDVSDNIAPQKNNTQGNELVSQGFKVVQIIADDFLTSLSRNSLPLWLKVLGLYCLQEDDINVALTSIGLLWRTADFLAKRKDVPAGDWLWVEVFQILKEVSADERPEIRNCAVKTLTGALTAHSLQLSASVWSACAERALLPLLEEVMQGGLYSKQVDENMVGGRGRNDNQVMWHHSRDTPRKQWNETRVLALGGVAKVLRSSMPRLAVLQDENERPLFLMLTDGGSHGLWRKMLRAAGVAASSRDREVAIAGVSALLELLSAAGFVVDDQGEAGTPVIETSQSAPAGPGVAENNIGASTSWMAGVLSVANQDSEELRERTSTGDTNAERSKGTVMLWEEVWSALAEAIGGVDDMLDQENDVPGKVNDSKIVDAKALQMLAEGLIDARDKLASKFTSRSSKMMVQVLTYLAACPEERQDENQSNGYQRVLTEVQEVTLSGLKDLSLGKDTESWTDLLHSILKLIPKQHKSVHQVIFTRRILEIVQALYAKNEMPELVKNSQLKIVLPVLGRIMLGRQKLEQKRLAAFGKGTSVGTFEGRDEGGERTLWKLGCDVLISTMNHRRRGLPEMNLNEEWNLFSDLLEKFLYSEKQNPGEVNEGMRYGMESVEYELYDIKLIECVSNGLQQMGPETSLNTKRKLLWLISRGAEEGEIGRRRKFVRKCQKQLFVLGDVQAMRSNDSTSHKIDDSIIVECMQHVIHTCGRVLGQYIADGQRGGRCPMPANRRAEAVFLLRQLKRMLWSDDGKRNKDASHNQVMELYPRLCECVESRDEAIRSLAREVLDETSTLVQRSQETRDVASAV